MTRPFARAALLLIAFAPACGAAPDAPASGTEPSIAANAPTYSDLFDSYFAAGTVGHCATAGCHGDPGHAVWRCGASPAECYAGMVEVGLIDPTNPARSAIIDAHRSPLTWLNPAGGTMPLDAQGPNLAAAEAIRAWVAAGAHDD